MSDSFPLLVLSFFLILHNVQCLFTVSEPLNQTLNGDGSISVTCMYEAPVRFGIEAKLKMNDRLICEIHNNPDKKNCKWENKGKSITFTWMNPEPIHNSEFSCAISKIHPLPIITRNGPKVKLFQGCVNSVAPLNPSCSYDDESLNMDPTPTRPPPEDTQKLLICILLIVVVMLTLYSIIITVAYLRVRISKLESSDTVTYVPMQRNVKRRDPDNTEYMDMREVQKRGGPHRDMNHNSHMIPSV